MRYNLHCCYSMYSRGRYQLWTNKTNYCFD